MQDSQSQKVPNIQSPTTAKTIQHTTNQSINQSIDYGRVAIHWYIPDQVPWVSRYAPKRRKEWIAVARLGLGSKRHTKQA